MKLLITFPDSNAKINWGQSRICFFRNCRTYKKLKIKLQDRKEKESFYYFHRSDLREAKWLSNLRTFVGGSGTIARYHSN